jgi:phosphate:Na+ symporter
MKLALFHTIFNIIGVLVVTPFIQVMVNFLQGLFVSKIPDEAKPKYINDVMIPVPESAIAALNKEIVNLYDQSFKAIAHGMSLHRTEILSGIDLKKVVTSSKNKFDTNIDQMYKNNIKDLYSEIIRFASIAQKNMNGEQNEKTDKLKISARKLIEAIKDIRELQKNINLFFRSKNKYIKAEYDFLRMGIANALKELDTIRKQEDGDIDTLSQIEMLKDRIKELDLIGNGRIDALIREQKIDARMATSLMNDSAFAYSISKKLIEVATVLWIEDKQIQELGEEDE